MSLPIKIAATFLACAAFGWAVNWWSVHVTIPRPFSNLEIWRQLNARTPNPVGGHVACDDRVRDGRCDTPARYEAMSEGANC